DPLHVLYMGELGIDAHRQPEGSELLRRDVSAPEFLDVLGVLIDGRGEALLPFAHGGSIPDNSDRSSATIERAMASLSLTRFAPVETLHLSCQSGPGGENGQSIIDTLGCVVRRGRRPRGDGGVRGER